MNDLDLEDAQANYRVLRDSVLTTQIASQGSEQHPLASYAPFVWHQEHLYLYLSELAAHTRNLRDNPAVGLMLIEDEAATRNPFARRRICYRGRARIRGRDDPVFAQVLAEFGRRFGAVMDVIEPLPDFHLFQISLLDGQFIQGFGQAYRLTGENLDLLRHLDPRQG